MTENIYAMIPAAVLAEWQSAGVDITDADAVGKLLASAEYSFLTSEEWIAKRQAIQRLEGR